MSDILIGVIGFSLLFGAATCWRWYSSIAIHELRFTQQPASLATFHILFRNKDDQFLSSAGDYQTAAERHSDKVGQRCARHDPSISSNTSAVISRFPNTSKPAYPRFFQRNSRKLSQC